VASKPLVEWLKILWENWKASVRCVVCCLLLSLVVLPCLVVPCGGGVRLPFIGQGESELHVCRTIQLHGEVWCAAP
jgi:hypothetical protein